MFPLLDIVIPDNSTVVHPQMLETGLTSKALSVVVRLENMIGVIWSVATNYLINYTVACMGMCEVHVPACDNGLIPSNPYPHRIPIVLEIVSGSSRYSHPEKASIGKPGR